MNITRKERLYMNELSKQVFGRSSRWEKILRKGERTEIVSKNREDQDVDVIYYERPEFERVKEVLEARAKEIKEKANVGSGQQQSETTGTTSSGDSGPASGTTGGPTEGTTN